MTHIHHLAKEGDVKVQIARDGRIVQKRSVKLGGVAGPRPKPRLVNCTGVAQSASIVTGPGIVISNPSIYLIFWGSWWTTNLSTSTFNAQLVQDQFQRMLAGPWGKRLQQYSEASAGYIAGTAYFTNDFTFTGANGPITAFGDPQSLYVVPTDDVQHCNAGSSVIAFDDAALSNVLLASIVQGMVPFPQNLDGLAAILNLVNPPSSAPVVYCVFAPPDAIHVTDSQACPGKFVQDGFAGANHWAEDEITINLGPSIPPLLPFKLTLDFMVHYFWTGPGSVDMVDYTESFSHELAELCSDASDVDGTTAVTIDLNTVVPSNSASGTGNQICDICEGFCPLLYGVTVSSYWSAEDAACVVPVYTWETYSPQLAPGGSIAVAVDGTGATNVLAVNLGAVQSFVLAAGATQWVTNAAPGQPGIAIRTGPPAIAANPGGRLEVFVSDGLDVAHAWQVAAGGAWSTFEPLGRPSIETPMVGAPTATASTAGKIYVGACTQDGNVYINTQARPGQAPWSGWNPLPPPPAYPATAPALVFDSSGNLFVFIQGALTIYVLQLDGGVVSGNGNWTAVAEILSLLPTPPAVARNWEGNFEIFASAGGGLAHVVQTSSGAWNPVDQWPPPVFTSSIASPPAVIQNTDGSLEVLALSSDGYLWRQRQIIFELPLGLGGARFAFFSGWGCLGAQSPDQTLLGPNTAYGPDTSWPPAVVVGSNGLGDAHAITSGYALAHIVQIPGGNDWEWSIQNSGCY